MPQHTVHLLAALFNPAVRRTEPGNTSFTFLTLTGLTSFEVFLGMVKFKAAKMYTLSENMSMSYTFYCKL